MSGVFYDKIPMRLKGQFYRSAVRPIMFYGSRCWVVDMIIEQSMSVAGMRIVRWMSEVTRE